MKMQVDNYQYVSFDMFDTLVYRNVSSPSVIFSLVEFKYNLGNSKKIKNFKVNRINSEQECRKAKNSEEITLADIYSFLKKYYSQKEIKKLYEIEEEIEILMTTPNIEMMDLYNSISDKNKIIITSDMYLSLETIKKILDKCGYKQYHKVYLSSKLNMTKNTGTIYKFIKEDLATENIIHIGDNRKADYINAKKNGLDAILYSPIKKSSNDDLAPNIVSSLCKNNLVCSDDYFYNFGFKNLGPLLFMFSKWLNQELKEHKINKVFFFSRDGYILQKSFDILFNESKITTKYFYASRRAIIVPSFWKYSSIDSIIDSIHWNKKITIKQMLKKFGLEDYNENKYLKKHGFSQDDVFYEKDLHNNQKLKNLIEDLKTDIFTNSKEEYKQMQKYISKTSFTGKVAIVDIGWFGNMQKALSNVLDNVDITGFYVALNPDGINQDHLKMYGYLFDKRHGIDIYDKEKSFNSIFELLFTAPHGSVKKYNDKSENMVDLYDLEYAADENLNNICNMQRGALQFIKDIKEIDNFFDLNLDLNYVSSLIMNVGTKPSYEDACKFGNLKFFDEEIKYLIEPDGGVKYLLKPKKLLDDFRNSWWKIGFMKKNLRISLPYYLIYSVLKKKGKK